jgi:hypothetical protein
LCNNTIRITVNLNGHNYKNGKRRAVLQELKNINANKQSRCQFSLKWQKLDLGRNIKLTNWGFANTCMQLRMEGEGIKGAREDLVLKKGP